MEIPTVTCTELGKGNEIQKRLPQEHSLSHSLILNSFLNRNTAQTHQLVLLVYCHFEAVTKRLKSV